MSKKTLIDKRFIVPLFVCVLFLPLVASAGGHGGMSMGGYSGQTMGATNYGYGSFSPSYNQAAWNMGSLGLYSSVPFSSLGYGSLSSGYGSGYSSYPITSRFGSFTSPSYGMSYGSALSGYAPGYGYGYTWGGSMGGGLMGSGSMGGSSMGGSDSDSGSASFSMSGSGASWGSDRTGASYSGQPFYGSFPMLNPLMYGFFVGWI